MHATVILLAVVVAIVPVFSLAQTFPTARVQTLTDRELPSLLELYRSLHRHPELSRLEKDSAARMASELRSVGYGVTEGVGGTGVVGVLENGNGPTVMVRADMDALPIIEETGLDYASTRKVEDRDGQEVGVMHACGHDMHMSVFTGTARVLKNLADTWQGTLVFVAQPAEEVGIGAQAMLDDGLFERFPRPDYALALHLSPGHAAGTIGYAEGFALANVDSLDITVRGVGGHGAMPHLAKDPVVLAAQIILALQTIISRESAATEPVVITVGQIHGGTKRNIIPDEVVLELTVRTYADDSRQRVLAAIQRVAIQTGRAAGLPDDKLPIVSAADEDPVPSLFNNPDLVLTTTTAMKAIVGDQAVIPAEPWMAAEDFARYGRMEPSIPSFLFFLGSTSPELLAQCQAGTATCPGLHNSRLSPDVEPTLRTGITAMVAAVLALTRPPTR
jgi:amidohydrolase